MIQATQTYQTALAAFKAGHIPTVAVIDGAPFSFCNFDPAAFFGSGLYPSNLVQWMESVDDYAYTLNDLDGGADVGNLCFTVQDHAFKVTASFPAFLYEGKQVTVSTGLPGLAFADFCQIFVGYIDTVSSENENNSYYFSCLDLTGKLSTVIYETGDDGQPTSSSNFRTLSAHPLDLLIDILVNQVKLPASQVDVATIQAFRDGPFAGLQFFFLVDQPSAAGDFIQNQLLKPLGGYYYMRGGQVSVNFFVPLSGVETSASMGMDTWTTVPSAEQCDFVNYVQWQFDKDDLGDSSGNNYDATDVEEYAASLAAYGYNNVGAQTITADGMRSALGGYFIARMISRFIFMRYGLKALKFDQNAADSIWSGMLVESGDYVSVTHPLVPDRASGVMGLNGKVFQVLDKTFKFEEGLVTFSMIDASYLQAFGFFQIAPDGTPDYAAASQGQKARYMFMSSQKYVYSNGDPAHTLG